MQTYEEIELDGGALVRYRNGSNPSYIIDPNINDREIMLSLIIQEIYRILGEGYIDDGFPVKSWDYYDNAKPSLLGGGKTFVGKGFGWENFAWESNGLWDLQRLAELSPNTNTRAMEYLLNDTMISLFGQANPHWKVGDSLAEIAVDFNNDDYAESTVTGWYDPVSGGRVWSWWWDGLGPYVSDDVDVPDYMRNSGWYRFYDDGTVKRRMDSRWIDISNDLDVFNEVNDIWLTGNQLHPIKPFAKTGRLFIGKSRLFRAFIRGEVYNLDTKEPMATSHQTFVFRVDGNGDDNVKDSAILMKKQFQMSFK
ncbi:MAG: hypothetical protein HRU15_09845 [Planctomycetes bacterium]|nr:hypothetical protein [Planctomycetota bacterium]